MRRRIACCAVCGRPRADHPLAELSSGCRQEPIAGWPRSAFWSDPVPIEREERDRVADVVQLELVERDQIAMVFDITTALLPVAFHDEAPLVPADRSVQHQLGQLEPVAGALAQAADDSQQARRLEVAYQALDLPSDRPMLLGELIHRGRSDPALVRVAGDQLEQMSVGSAELPAPRWVEGGGHAVLPDPHVSEDLELESLGHIGVSAVSRVQP